MRQSAAPLREEIRDEVSAMLSKPMDLPYEFRGWIPRHVENAGMTRSEDLARSALLRITELSERVETLEVEMKRLRSKR